MKIGLLTSAEDAFAVTLRHLPDFEAAAAAVPDQLLRTVSLVGPRAWVAERVAALRASGVTGINAAPVAPDIAKRISDIAVLKEIAA